MNEFSPDMIFKELYARAPELSYEKCGSQAGYKDALAAKLAELLGEMPEKVDPEPRTVWVKDRGIYLEKRIVFRTEKDVWAPCCLLVPKNAKGPLPAVICLQGHSPGMHISLGHPKTLKDLRSIRSGERDYAVQAVKRGYCALALEQRGFGERQSSLAVKRSKRCDFIAYNALLFGRTLLGQRVWDVSRAIDLLETLPEVDSSKIACLGNSGGGTVTYYAACVDKRIKLAMPSCSVCTYRDSIGSVYHCACNYIPNSARYFDMGDLALLIAPRPLIVVAGKKDTIFPIKGVRETYALIRKIYEDTGAGDRCRLVEGEGGHRFYSQAWKEFGALFSSEVK